jgi:hypothetical protein
MRQDKCRGNSNKTDFIYFATKSSNLLCICSGAFARTIFDEIFSGYQPRQVSTLNRRFPKDDDRDGSRNVGSIQTPNTADSPRRFHRIYYVVLQLQAVGGFG